MAESKIPKSLASDLNNLFVRVSEVSGTTDANGNILIPAPSVARIVLFAWDGTHVFIPFYYLGKWYARVQRSDVNGTAFANESVLFNYFYV